MAKASVELDFATFIASIENWDGENPPFDEVMRSALLLSTFLFRGERFALALKDKIECAGSTIMRYGTGVARPMPGVMKLVVREARALLIEMEEQSRKEHSAMVAFFRNVGDCGPDD